MKLSPEAQKQFSTLGEEVEPVLNKWVLQGWTTFHFAVASREIIMAALETADYDAS